MRALTILLAIAIIAFVLTSCIFWFAGWLCACCGKNEEE